MKQKPKVSTLMIILICIMVVLYAAADFLLQYYTGSEISPTLTVSWFSFWGVELINLAVIKTTKVKYEKVEPNVNEEAKG